MLINLVEQKFCVIIEKQLRGVIVIYFLLSSLPLPLNWINFAALEMFPKTNEMFMKMSTIILKNINRYF